MLPLNPEIVCNLITMARRYHVKEDVVIPDPSLSPTSDWGTQILSDHRDDPIYQEFSAVIDTLEPDQKLAVVALMWIGRGDFEPSEWDVAVKLASEESTVSTVDYLLSTPLLAEYLSEGLDRFGYSCDE